MNNTILVTGGAGYIGSHACKALAKAGYNPVTLDDLSTGHAELVKWGALEQCDIRDTQAVAAAIRRHKPVGAMHFAGLISVAESVQNPNSYYDHNVSGTLSLLNAMRECNVQNIVFSSTCAVHGIPHLIPISEDAPYAPISPYGASKWMCERVISDACFAYGLNAMLLRYFNACGADADGQTGEMHEPETHLIPLALRAAASGTPFYVNGTDYPTADGTCIRDYIHVSDLAEAHVRAMRHILEHSGLHKLNLGTGHGTSIMEIIRSVESVTGKKLDIHYSARREGDPPMLVANNAKATALLDFIPQYSDIAHIVRTAWQWEQEHPHA